ncbi:MAG: type II toxin-antitoxin system VapC family toxin [Gammaproteobacteria bacterium]|nr:type II toxin-antitoxin system VapC family toxin [Gammaproteobacteria bacterium]
MFYVDSAVLVALHCEESVTAAIRRWIARRRGPWYASEWVLTECVSAFGLKVRRKEIQAAAAELAVESITELMAESFTMIPITPDHHAQARAWLRDFKLPLRAADALHLAIAAQSGCRLATYDTALLTAAQALRVAATKTS